MSVRELLAEEDGGFVSLDALLRHMMDAGDCDYQEAASFLFRRLNHAFNQDAADVPTIYRRTSTEGIQVCYGGQRRILDLLDQAAREGSANEIIF